MNHIKKTSFSFLNHINLLTKWERLLFISWIPIFIITIHSTFIAIARDFHSDRGVMNWMAREMFLALRFVAPDFLYAHEIYFMEQTLIMALLYPIINDQLLLHSLSSFILSIILFIVLILVGKNVLKSKSYIVYIPIIFSYTSSFYTDMLIVGNANDFVTILFILIFLSLTFSVDEVFNIKFNYMACSLFLVLMSTIRGTRHVGTTIIPVVISFTLVYIIENHDKKLKKIYPYIKKFIAWCVLIITAVCIGYFINRQIPNQANGFTHPMLRSYQDVGSIFESMRISISGIWFLFGIERQVSLLSIHGFANVIRLFASFVFLIVLPLLLTKQYKYENLRVKRLIVFSWVSFATTLFLVLFTSIVYAPHGARYFIPNIVMLVVLSCHYLYKYIIRKSEVLCLVAIIMLASILFSFNYETAHYIVRYRNTRSDYLVEKRQIRDELRDRELELGFATYWVSHQHSALFDFDPIVLPVLNFSHDSKHLESMPFHTSIRFNQPDYHVGSTFLLLSSDEYSLYLETFYLQHALGEPREVFQQSGMVVLVFDYNITHTFHPSSAIDVLDLGSEEVSSISLQHFNSNNGSSTDNGLTSDGTEGFLMFGPYMFLDVGEYEAIFTLTLDSYTQNHAGFLDVVKLLGAEELSRFSMNVDDFESDFQMFSLAFQLYEAATDLEFRVFSSLGTVLTVSDITLIRK